MEVEGSASLVRANALALPLADGFVDLIVTSPPYFALRDYKDDDGSLSGQIGAEQSVDAFVDALMAATSEMVRVLKPGGSIWVNLGDKYAGSGGHNNKNLGGAGRGPTEYPKRGARPKSLIGIPWRYAIRCIDELGLILRAEVIWSKPNGLPESVTDRVRRSHEQWFHFVREPRYYSAVDAVREPYMAPPAKAQKSKATSSRAHRNPTTLLDSDLAHNPLGKLPGSVWTVATEPLKVPTELGVDHFAAFPSEWPRRIILAWSPPEGIVLDPFGGTGTTAAVAKALGRHGISIDLSAAYLRLARWRTEQDGYQKIHAKIHRSLKPAKRRHRTNPTLFPA